MTSLVARLLLLYRRYLASFFFSRLCKAVALSSYRSSYRLYCRLLRHSGSGDYRLLALAEARASIGAARLTLNSSASVFIPAPNFYGFGVAEAAAITPALDLAQPTLSLTEFAPAMVVGGVDLVFVKGSAIHHDLFDPARHPSPAGEFGVVSPRVGGVSTPLYLAKSGLAVDAGATLIGQCSFNYAHWLTESLAKLPILDSSAEYAGLPLLVDDALHPNIVASIDLVNRTRRPVIRVGRWQPVFLERVVVVSAPGYERYVPVGVRAEEPEPQVNEFSQAALAMLRASVVAACSGMAAPVGKRIYFARSKTSSNLRHVENIEVLEALLRSLGIQSVMLEHMSFAEQVIACMHAELIIAPIGAALANMIFAPPGCRVVVLAPQYPGANYFYYTNLAGVLGHRLTFVLGPQVGPRRHPRQRSYHIDIEALQAALE